MWFRFDALVALLVAAGDAPDPAAEWPALIAEGDFASAQARCREWLKAAEPRTRAEAHKCLANVEAGLAARQAAEARGRGAGGADLTQAGIRRAVRHLDEALALAPEDLSIHQGRLHLLRMGGWMTEMVSALEDSIRRHPGTDWLPAWKGYAREYYEAQRFEQAVLLYRVLDRRFPSDHTIISNMGAALTMLHRDDEALACFTRAVQLAPDDPIDNWNLARQYDFMGRLDLAERGYERALALTPDPAARATGACVFAEFLQKKRNQRERACFLQRKAACPRLSACPEEVTPR